MLLHTHEQSVTECSDGHGYVVVTQWYECGGQASSKQTDIVQEQSSQMR